MASVHLILNLILDIWRHTMYLNMVYPPYHFRTRKTTPKTRGMMLDQNKIDNLFQAIPTERTWPEFSR